MRLDNESLEAEGLTKWSYYNLTPLLCVLAGGCAHWTGAGEKYADHETLLEQSGASGDASVIPALKYLLSHADAARWANVDAMASAQMGGQGRKHQLANASGSPQPATGVGDVRSACEALVA